MTDEPAQQDRETAGYVPTIKISQPGGPPKSPAAVPLPPKSKKQKEEEKPQRG